jgi:hypothetical protein
MPQPIDMQSELGRTMAAERIQDAAARAALLAQQRAQIDAEQQRAAREQVVAETHETENEGVNEEGKGKQREREQRPSRRLHERTGHAPRPSASSGEDHTLDVTV